MISEPDEHTHKEAHLYFDPCDRAHLAALYRVLPANPAAIGGFGRRHCGLVKTDINRVIETKAKHPTEGEAIDRTK